MKFHIISLIMTAPPSIDRKRNELHFQALYDVKLILERSLR